MLRKHITAVRPRRNVFGKPVRRRISLAEVVRYGLDWSKAEFLDLLDRGYLFPRLEGGTTPSNTVMANPVYFPKSVVVSTDQTINQGDMVWWDSVNYTLKVCTTRAQVPVSAGVGGYCGVAQGGNVPGLYPDPPGGVPSEKLPGVSVQRGGTARLNLQTNDVVDFPFQPVEPAGVDAQTVTKGGGADSTHEVGLVIVPLPVNARGAPGTTPVPETVPGGTAAEVWLTPQFPQAVLL